MAFFYSVGKILVITKDVLKIMQREPVIAGAAVFKSFAEILSSPSAFLLVKNVRFKNITFIKIILIEMLTLLEIEITQL